MDRPCNCSGDLSLASTLRGPGTIPGSPKWDSQQEKRCWHQNQFLVFPCPEHSTTAHSFVVVAFHSIINNACKCIFPDRLMKITKYFIRTNVWPNERIGSCQILPTYETNCRSYEQVSVFRHYSETLNFATFLCVVS